MIDTIQLILGIGIPLILIIVGLTAGRITEKRHFADLVRREQAVANMLVTDLRSFPLGTSPQPAPQIIVGEAVIGTDYFKSFISGLRKLIGGELKSYQTLVERARREALLRVMETASQQGYDAICNVRLDTADVGASDLQNKAKVTTVGIIVSATAYRRR